MNISNITFNADNTVTIVTTDGVSTVYSTVTTPVVAPEDTEVDIVLSDGSVKKFVPAV